MVVVVAVWGLGNFFCVDWTGQNNTRQYARVLDGLLRTHTNDNSRSSGQLSRIYTSQSRGIIVRMAAVSSFGQTSVKIESADPLQPDSRPESSPNGETVSSLALGRDRAWSEPNCPDLEYSYGDDDRTSGPDGDVVRGARCVQPAPFGERPPRTGSPSSPPELAPGGAHG